MQVIQNIIIGILLIIGLLVILYIGGYMLISGCLAGWENFIKRKQSNNQNKK
jgi:hypothetical protein